MINFTFPLLLALFVCSASALAEGPASQAAAKAAPADPSTPRGALKTVDKALPDGGLKAARNLYHATDDKQRKAANAMAESDLAAAKLAKLVRQKFGDKAAEQALHAMRQFTAADIDAADEQINGDKATVGWPDDREPLEMVKIDGNWKVSVAQLLAGDDGDDAIKEVIETNQQMVKELEKTAQELKAGEYANAVLLQRAISQRMFRLMGDDE
jgi:hypothetical protein